MADRLQFVATRLLTRRGMVWLALAAALALPAEIWPGAAGETPSLEGQVKAAFLAKLAMFVEWPAGTFADAAAPICIGILGEDPFGSYLDEVARQERVNGRSLQTRRVRDLAGLQGCHIVFVSPSESARLPQVLQALEQRPVLTVGDEASFAQRGGIVSFIKASGKVGFAVNLDAARQAGMKLSAKFLQVAKVLPHGGVGTL